jgi:hypothetical protein
MILDCMWKYNLADSSSAGHLFFGMGGGGGVSLRKTEQWLDVFALCVIHFLHTTVNAMSVHSHFCSISVQFL